MARKRTPREQLQLLTDWADAALEMAPKGTDTVLMTMSRRQVAAIRRALAGLPLDNWRAPETERGR